MLKTSDCCRQAVATVGCVSSSSNEHDGNENDKTQNKNSMARQAKDAAAASVHIILVIKAIFHFSVRGVLKCCMCHIRQSFNEARAPLSL